MLAEREPRCVFFAEVQYVKVIMLIGGIIERASQVRLIKVDALRAPVFKVVMLRF